MRRAIRHGVAVAAATVLAVIGGAAAPAVGADPSYKVLVFSKTAGFRHDAIPAGVQAIRELGGANNFTVDATEDSAAFTTANLAQYRAVVFLSTTGDVLTDPQQSAFESYVNGGGGYVGVHAAADTEYSWPWYGTLVGAWFDSHPAIQQATVKVDDRANPATAHLGATWVRTDEWYNYRTSPRSKVHVLLSLDETSYSGGGMGADHPHAWCQKVSGGRSFYTGGGHTVESYADAAFRAHLLGGIRYAAGVVTADCSPPAAPGGTVEAEAFTSQSGITVSDHASASGGKTAGYIENGDWTGYAAVSTANAKSFAARISSAGSGGTIQVRSGSATGTLLGSVAVPVTGNWETFQTVTATLTGTATGPLHLVYTGGGGFLFDVDTFTLTTGSPGGPRSGTVLGLGGKCMSVSGGASANGTAIILFGCNGHADQTWTLPGDGTVRSLGKCLDVSGYGTANGSLTHLWDCANPPSANQLWAPQADGSLKNPVSGRCLDAAGNSSADGTRLHLWDCLGAPNQKWQLPL